MIEELKHFLPLLSQYILELEKHKDKAEQIIEKYFNVLPNELLGGRFVDRFLEEKDDKTFNLLLEVLRYRKEVIENLTEENKSEYLIKNEFLLNFLI